MKIICVNMQHAKKSDIFLRKENLDLYADIKKLRYKKKIHVNI